MGHCYICALFISPYISCFSIDVSMLLLQAFRFPILLVFQNSGYMFVVLYPSRVNVLPHFRGYPFMARTTTNTWRKMFKHGGVRIQWTVKSQSEGKSLAIMIPSSGEYTVIEHIHILLYESLHNHDGMDQGVMSNKTLSRVCGDFARVSDVHIDIGVTRPLTEAIVTQSMAHTECTIPQKCQDIHKK